MANLASLKKKRGANLKQLQEKLEQANQGGGRPRDERIWKPKFNAEKGKGICIVRFLPAKDGEPFVEQLSYSFNGPGGNFYGLARQTISEDDPVQIAAINAFRKAKVDGDKHLYEQAKKFLPKRQYFANVYIIKDQEVPENEGKTKIWQFGPAIYNKLKAVIQPEFDDVNPLDPFDLWEGADFKVRQIGTEIPDSKTGKMVKVPNYDSSGFDAASEFMNDDDDVLEAILEGTYDLSEFIAPDKFDSYEKVKERFKAVTGKPFNWLTTDGVEEHVEEEEQKKEIDKNQDNDSGVDKHRKEPAPEKEADSGKDEEEDPVARFRRMAGQS
jgi:hypothetical protein